ncbi:Ig-like domain-containing protein, partial [uncultured Roseivirga sp.]|uniref:Ig-like domain-containing protein n=1 Tax=uncultured Roseivirga sp. TaxID=543088 RepID=UPI0030DA5E06
MNLQAQVTTGSTITFEAGAPRQLTGASTNPSVANIDGHNLGVSAVTAGDIVNITINNTFTGISGGTDLAVIMTATGTNVTSFSFKSDNAANNFGVTSFAFAVATGTTQNITVQGYDGGSPVSGAITKTIVSPGETNFTISSGDISGSSGWSNIDEIRMTMNTPAPANFAIDDVLLTAAAASNTAPTIGGASAGQNVNDNATISPFSGITITDADGDNVTATITLDNNAKGVITGADGGAGPYTMTSKTAAAMQTALRALVFNPTDNRTSTSETTTFTVVVNDGTVDATNNTTTVVSSAVAPVISQVTPVATPTNDNTPNYTFTTNETGTFSLGGSCGTSTSTTISGTGNQTITLTQTNNSSALADGTYSNCTVTVTDAGGKASSPLSITSFTVDTQAPTTPGTPDLIGGFDSGTSSTDNITSVTQPRFAGTGIEVGVTIKISSSINGLVGTTTTNVGGSYSYIITGTLSEGTHNITVTATDAAGNESSSSSALSVVVDTSAPTLSSSSPADDATGVNTSGNITLTFNENIAFGTGNIEVIDETNGSNSFTIDAASPGTQASISGAVLTINPSSNLDLSSNYSVRIAATAIDDIAGNSYAGITNGTVLNFGTNNAPTVTVNTGLTLNEGATELIDSGKLNASDTEGGTLTFTITTATTKGTLFIDTNPSNTFNAGDTELVLNATFTKNDLDSDRIRYVSTTDNDISDSFVFKVADPDGGELTNQTFNITITPVNDAPTATGIPTDIVVIEDIASNFDLSSVTFADPEDNQLTVTIVVSAGSFGSPVDGAAVGAGVVETLVNATTITLVGSPADINTYLDTPANIKYTGASNVNGADAATYTINANDGTVNPQVGSGNIDITAVNDEPSFTIGVNTTVAQNAGAQTVNGFISVFDDGDPEVAQTLSFNVANNNNGLFTVQPAISATGVLTFTPDATKFGKAVVTVSIQDNGANGGNDDNISANQTFNIYVTPISIKINEAHPSAVSTSEFVEIYDGGAGNTDITGLVLVMFNGGDDLAYKDVSPTGSTDGTGFYVIGDAGVTNLDLSWGAFDLQNGPDAIALYVGAESDFTSASPPTTDGLVDVLFYGSSDDATLRAALGNSALIAAGDGSNSLSRSPDGTGGFLVQASTPGAINDVTAPTVTSVSGPANATYIANQNLDFTVNFSENVTVVTTGGTPQLAVTIGSTTRQATYQSGSGTSALLFRYVVQSGELDTDGIVLGNLVTNGGTLQDAAGNNATLTLNSVGVTTSILVDSSAPTVTSVSVPANATYIANQNLDFTVNFSENVTVVTTGGTPQLAITIGSTTRQATYQSGSGTQALLFRYTVVSGELDTDGIVVGNLVTNGGTLQDAAGNNATLTLNSVGVTTSILVDSSAPTVTSVSVPANATYIANQNLDFTVNFSENVTVVTTGGTPQLAITIGSTTRQATYQSGSGTQALLFRYTVVSGELDTDGIVVGNLIANGGTLKDAAGNNATLTLNSVGATTSVLVDSSAPTITSLGLANSNAFIEIFLNEGVFNTNGGSGALEISDIAISISGGTATNPVITSLKKVDGTTDLTGGENIIRVTFTTTGVADGSEVVKIDFADGSSVFDAAGNAASATQSNNTRTLNDLIKPNITGVSLAADNSYIDVTFNEGVYEDNCTGGGLQASDFNLSISNGTATTPVISSVKKNDNTAEGSATALTGGETVVRIFFSVTGTPDGAETLEVDLQANAVFDANGLAAEANQNTNNTAALNDKVVPTVLEVTSNATNGTFKVGDNINIYVQYSEEVLVTGTPQLELETGTTDRTINYVDRSVSTLRFVYTVQAGDVSADLDVTSSTALSLNGGTIKDAAGNNASLTVQQGATGGSLASNKAIVIDGVVPTITSVSVPADGIYKTGSTFTFTVTVSESVVVTNTPQLPLDIGGVTRQATYQPGLSTTTLLRFQYTVQSGDLDPTDGISLGASLDLNTTGTIKDGAGNNLVLTLPIVPSTAAVLVDGVVPTVTNVTSSTADGTYKIGDQVNVQVVFSEVIYVNTINQIQLQLETGTLDYYIAAVSGSGTNTLNFTYTVQAGTESADLDYKATNSLDISLSGTARDAAGNDAVLTLPAPGAANSLGANKAIVIDGVAPVITSVSSVKVDGSYGLGES